MVAGVWKICKITKISKSCKMGWEWSGELQTGAKLSAHSSERFQMGFDQQLNEKAVKKQIFPKKMLILFKYFLYFHYFFMFFHFFKHCYTFFDLVM